ncbi:MAG: PKD domain-containing protein [Bacteroidota bacterium]
MRYQHLRISPILLTSLLLTAMWGCKLQELPDENIGEPTFYLQGTLGGENLSLVAGEKEYYLETGYRKDPVDVYVFQGAFEKAPCTDCRESLQIEIRGERQNPTDEPEDIASALPTGTYRFIEEVGPRLGYEVHFEAEDPHGNNSGYNWDFGDGNMSGGASPIHQYPDTSLESVMVCLETTDTNGCTGLVCNEVEFKDMCQAEFIHELDSTIQYISFKSTSSGQAPFRYRWDFGDGFGASLGNPGYYYGDLDDYKACLTIEDATGCRSTFCKEISADPNKCQAGFKFQVFQLNDPNPLDLSKVRIRWVSENGVEYRSDLVAQAAASNFEVISSEPYDRNRFGQPTQKLGVKFSCLVADADGNEIFLENIKGVVALGYPDLE